MLRQVIIDPDGERQEAFFHCFGLCFEEFRDGAASYTVAICELPNGRLKEVYLSHIQFVTPATTETP